MTWMCQKAAEADDHTKKSMNEETVDQLFTVPLQIKYFYHNSAYA